MANKAQDGVRDLRSFPANYTSFRVRSDGTLSRPVSSIDVPPGSSPLQAYVTPDRKVLITSEEAGVFRAFRIGPGGTLSEGPDSPQRLPNAVFPHGHRVPFVWPAGLASHPRLKLLYAQLANLSRTVVYRWTDQARLTFVRVLANQHSFLPCWTEVNRAGTRMYSGNAGSDNISVFDISRRPASPRQIQSVALDAPGNPWNFADRPERSRDLPARHAGGAPDPAAAEQRAPRPAHWAGWAADRGALFAGQDPGSGRHESHRPRDRAVKRLRARRAPGPRSQRLLVAADYIIPDMSGMPPPPPPAPSFSGTSATIASVVRMFLAIDAAF